MASPLPLLLLLLLAPPPLPLLPAAPGAHGQETPGPRPSRPPPGPGAATLRAWGADPPGASAATIKEHWPESNTELLESVTFDQNQVNYSTVTSKEGTLVQAPRKSHSSSDAPERRGAFQTKRASDNRRDESSTRVHVTISSAEPETMTALTSQNSTRALGRLHLPSSSSGFEERTAFSQTEAGTSQSSLVRNEEPPEVLGHTHTGASSVRSQSLFPAVEMGEMTTLSKKKNSMESGFSWQSFSRTHSPSPNRFADSGRMEDLNNSTALLSLSTRETKSVHVATTFPDGVPGLLQSLTDSLEPLKETDPFPEDTEVTATSLSTQSSPSWVELSSKSGVAGNVGNGEFTEHGFDPTSSEVSVGFWQNDLPTSGGHQLASSSDTEDRNPMSQSEAVSSRSIPLVRGGHSTAYWFLLNSKTSANVTGNSTSYPDVVNSTILTQFAASAPLSRGSDTMLHDSHTEPSSESLSSSSEGLHSSAPHATAMDSELGFSSEAEEGEAASHGPHTSAALSGAGERTLRSLANLSTASRERGRSATAPGGTESLMVTGETRLTSGLPADSQAVGVTRMSEDQASDTDVEQRTLSELTDHTYVSSTFTKGERALLSITDNSSSLDIRESATSSATISDSSHSGHSFSSQAQTGGSEYKGPYAQPSTESLAHHTAHPPSSTPTVNMANTLVLLHSDTRLAGEPSSSSGSPLALPSVSQSHQPFSSTLPPTKAPLHPPHSTPGTQTLLSSSPPIPVSQVASTPTPLSTFQATLPPSPTTEFQSRTGSAHVTSAQTLTMASSVAMLPGTLTEDPENQSNLYHKNTITESEPPDLGSLSTEATRDVTMSPTLIIPLPSVLTEPSTEKTLPTTSTRVAHTSPVSTATGLKTSHPLGPTPGPSSSTVALVADLTTVQTVTAKQFFPNTAETPVPHLSTRGDTTTVRSPVHSDVPTQLILQSSVSTPSQELTTGRTEEFSPASRSPGTSLQTTGVSPTELLTPESPSSTPSPTAQPSPAPANNCASNPCLHGGKCVEDSTSHGYRCVCSPSWQGDDCSVDVNECLQDPCPPLAVCNNTQGSFTCNCPIGYQMEKGICNLVRTFVAELRLQKTYVNSTVGLHEVENDVTKMLNVCFSSLPGYIRSTVHASRESSAVVVSLQTTYSLASNVTFFDLTDRTQKCVNSCRSSAEFCQILGSQRRIFRGSLCKRKTPECDKETSICTDLDGVALCQCKLGYFQFNKMDHSCRACEDGYRLENETCMSCPFGLGGLNCGNPYQLITVVIAAAGGGLLLILGIALIVTCCRKNKNDISKLIFKSGDFQMSPYAEYPKNPRSQEWGREAIEMHENGSTKNLLQMTDVYYSPVSVRNPELERNGLYPAYCGLPGSRHSCIFPGQYNPSFISDESRRRDYF